MIQLLRLIFGAMLVTLLFVPFGAYHTRTEPYVLGLLFGFNLPVGYIALLCGILLILYPKLAISKKIASDFSWC